MQVFYCDLCKKELKPNDNRYSVVCETHRYPTTETLFYQQEICKDCAVKIANFANELREERK